MRLFDTRSRSLIDLAPSPARVGIYICGPTVYARAHVGNARPFLLGMWLRNWLLAQGRDVTFVHNITDVNDKIFQAAPEHSAALADAATQWYIDDISDLQVGLPDRMPRATEFIADIIAYIGELIGRGAAYAAGSDVYFDVTRDESYGELSGHVVAEAEDRADNALKRAPQDFALWKGQHPGEDVAWDSPWGRGRPGWHIECSVMAQRTLGRAFEIHGGGNDLTFPHHENELAQCRAIGDAYARIWMHNGMLKLAGEKMSKSQGNIATIREVVDEWGAEALVLLMMNARWRGPVDFSDESMRHARARAMALRDAFVQPAATVDMRAWRDLTAALADDFDTPKALTVMHSWARSGQLDLLRRALTIFGLAKLADLPEPPPDIRDLAERRQRLRAAREWLEADALRDQVERAGWSLREGANFEYVLIPAGRRAEN